MTKNGWVKLSQAHVELICLAHDVLIPCQVELVDPTLFYLG